MKRIFGANRDEDIAANVPSFAVVCHILQVKSLFKTSLDSMSRTDLIPRNDANTLFATNPSIMVLSLNLDTNISATASNQKGVSTKHLAKVWRIDTEAAKNALKAITQLKRNTKSVVLFN